MKQNKLAESIYGCPERIENMINALSMPQSVDGNSETDNSANEVALQEVTQEPGVLKTGFRHVLEALAMIKGDTSDLLKRDSAPNKFKGTLSVLKSEQQESHEQQKDMLRRFAETEMDNLKLTAEKMEKLSASVKERMNNPDITNHRHSASIDMPHMFRTIIMPITYSVIVSVAFYIEKQPDYGRIDNDLKYRYTKMKGEASPVQIGKLEKLFELNRDNAGIERRREDVVAYEKAVRKQAALAEQAHLKGQAAKALENKVESIKGKSIRDESKK